MSGQSEELAHMFGRELDRLAGEIEAYRRDQELWKTSGGQKNAPGTLAVHVVGNLSAFVGGALGESGYVRDRDREFAERDVPRNEMARRIRECRETVVRVLSELDEGALNGPFPGELPPPMRGLSTRAVLLHLLWHLGWHTGQVYYHRLGLEKPAPA